MKRPYWNQYFMEIAEFVSTRSTCVRRQVGAVIVDENKKIIGTGYNGAPSGIEHCTEETCIRKKLNIPSGTKHELCMAVHAEQNAIIQSRSSLKDCTIYVTHQPCVICAKMLINTGIKKIIYKNPYPDELTKEILKQTKIIFEVLR